MSDLYFGKFSTNYPDQINERFYAASSEGNVWYGGIKPGDYVFPIYNGKVSALWKVREYGNKQNKINTEDSGVVFFDLVKEYKQPVILSNEFTRYKYFEQDLNILNKSSKAVKSCGFHKISTSKGCPDYSNIEFKNNIRNMYIALENKEINLENYDVLVCIDSVKEARITGIKIFMDGALKEYKTLMELYDVKNEQKYTLHELIMYAKKDNAKNKLTYLQSVLKDLSDSGMFVVDNPIALYDNILVGRKKSSPPKPQPDSDDIPPDGVIDELSQYEKFAELLNFNPNLILYGPPGTGKTYSTQKIVEAYEKLSNDQAVPFKQVENEGRVKFITFHQAYSYEEFIEGIRPNLNIENNNEESGGLQYCIEDGILKQMANMAALQTLKSDTELKGSELITDSSTIWKVSLGTRYKKEYIYEDCRDKSEIAIGWLEDESLEGKGYDEIFKMLKDEREDGGGEPYNDASSINNFINEMNIGDVALIYEGPKTIRDIVVIKGKYEFRKGNEYPRRRKVEWIKYFKEPKDIYNLNGRTRLTLKSVYPLDRFNFSDLAKLVMDEDDMNKPKQNERKALPYYLIIDEINRGNISKIFGELITLIEGDKRGRLSCTLLYSKKPFTLPENLYIIGTMNTADRSIALLDTALRRRFSFVEIEPDIEIFNNPDVIPSPKVNGRVDLAKLLRKLNENISIKLDRDHRIGHAYFMNIVNLSDLYNVWYYKIVPLLMEYFYGDIETLKGLVGSVFFNSYGSVNFLSIKPENGQVSEFENALIKIYSKDTSNE